MQTGRLTIEHKSHPHTDGTLYKAACIIGTGLFCACFVLAVLS